MGSYELVKGDLLDSDVEALVNTVNCVGVMGRGLALQFKRRFPRNYADYRSACDAGEVAIGRVHVHETGLFAPRYVFNFPTKNHWRNPSTLAYVRTGLDSLESEIRRLGVRSVGIPALGCDLGGLEWDDVMPLIVATVTRIPGLHAMLFEPHPGVASIPGNLVGD